MLRFWSKVNKTNTCWEWIASAKNKDGYGGFKSGAKTVLAHRFSWELHNGPILDISLCVCHRCDNPKCVRPEHLFLGTKNDNNQDKVKKNRQAKMKGENHPSVKLTHEQVREIRELYSKFDWSTRSLAKQYNVTQANVWYIVKNKTWRD